MLGLFIIPFFILQTFLGLLGLSIFLYLFLSRIIKHYLLIKFSLVADTAIITMDQFYFTPSILNCLGVVLFIFGTIFTISILWILKDISLRRYKFFTILFYMLIYLTVYPFIMISAIHAVITGKSKWR